MEIVFIWRDSQDPDVFHIGSPKREGYRGLHCWVSIQQDGMEELFGLPEAALRHVGIEPVPVKLSCEFA